MSKGTTHGRKTKGWSIKQVTKYESSNKYHTGLNSWVKQHSRNPALVLDLLNTHDPSEPNHAGLVPTLLNEDFY